MAREIVTVKEESSSDEIKIAFVPKITENGFFQSAWLGALEMGDELGVTVTYEGPSECNVARQIECINKLANQGYDAIAISALSPTALNESLMAAQEQGAKILTWDSDVDPAYRTFYISQGSPEQLGRLLVEMAADQMPGAKTDAKQVAFFYSSPQVTDQNSWVDVAKAIIAEEYPNWEIVATQYGYQDPQRSLRTATDIFSTYEGLDAIICPDSTALPAAAQAAEDLSLAGEVIIVGFSTPNAMRQYVKSGTVNRFALWDVVLQGKLSVYMAYQLATGKTYHVGDKIEVPGVGVVEVSPNGGRVSSRERENSGTIFLPERIIFTIDNIDDYDF